MPARRAFFNRYSPPRTDSQRAIANAINFLVSMRNVDHLDAAEFAYRKSLKVKTAEYLIGKEKMRRAARG